MNRGDLLFVNFNLKGYNKNSDVKYALSENELFFEVRDKTSKKVHRLCKTLFKSVVPVESNIQLLVDFIVIQLKKAKGFEGDDAKVIWDQLGYDCAQFTKPTKMQSLRSNFMKSDEEVEMEKNKREAKGPADKENINVTNEVVQEIGPAKRSEFEDPALTEEQKLELAK